MVRVQSGLGGVRIAGVVLCIVAMAGVIVGCGTAGGGGSSAPVTFAPGEDDEFFLFPGPVARDGSRPADVAVDWMDRELGHHPT